METYLAQMFTHLSFNSRLSKLFHAPLYDAMGSIVLTASRLWHPFEARKIGKLQQIAAALGSRAKDCRRIGLQEIGPDKEGCNVPGLLYSYSFHHSYYSCHEPEKRVRNRSEDLAGACVCLDIVLRFAEESIDTMEELRAADRSLSFLEEEAKGLKEVWEDLSDIRQMQKMHCAAEIPSAVLNARKYAAWCECEGLAAMQGKIEDTHSRLYGNGAKTKCDLTDEQICKLAGEIDVKPEILKEVLEEPHSGWWDISRQFHAKAENAVKDIFEPVQMPQKMLPIIRPEFRKGSCTDDGYCNTIRNPQETALAGAALGGLIARYERAAGQIK